MESCYYLYGTAGNDLYSMLDRSDDLQQFLKGINAINLDQTINEVRNTVCPSYPKLKDYDVPPLAVRYAPMHLYKLESMPSNIKRFCALGYKGIENKPGRETQFDLSIYIPAECMDKPTTDGGEQYTYLDRIFGYSEYVNWVKVKRVREKRERFQISKYPMKVNPGEDIYRTVDGLVAINCCKEIYNDRAVVIVAENKADINRRAEEILKKIYCLLPPRFASEIGFAAFIDPGEIQDCLTGTSIRLFVIPEEFSEKLPNLGDKVTVIRLSDPKSIASLDRNSELDICLYEWSKFSRDDRAAAMYALFNDVQDFASQNIFVDRSNLLFEQIKKFAEWRKSGIKPDGIEAVYREYGSYSITLGTRKLSLFDAIPSLKEVFRKKTEESLKEGIEGELLLIDKLDDSVADKHRSEIYNFLANLNDASFNVSTLFFSRATNRKTEISAKDRISQAEAEKNGALEERDRALEEKREIKAECEKEIAATKADSDKKIADTLAKCTKAVESVKAECRKTLIDKEEKCSQQLKDKESEFEKRLAEKNNEYKTAINEVKYRSDCDLKKAQSNIARLQKEKAELTSAIDLKTSEVDALKLETEKLKKKLQRQGSKVGTVILSLTAGCIIGAGAYFGVTYLLKNLNNSAEDELTSLPAQAVETVQPMPGLDDMLINDSVPNEPENEQPAEPITDWSSPIDAASKLRERLPEIDGDRTDGLCDSLPEDEELEDYYPLASFSIKTLNGEDYVFILKPTSELSAVEMDKMENELNANSDNGAEEAGYLPEKQEKQEEGEAESGKTEDETEDSETKSADDEQIPADTEDAQAEADGLTENKAENTMKFLAAGNGLAVYTCGGERAVQCAIKIMAAVGIDEAEIKLTTDDGTDISDVFQEIAPQDVTNICLSEGKLKSWQETIPEDLSVYAVFDYEEGSILVIKTAEQSTEETPEKTQNDPTGGIFEMLNSEDRYRILANKDNYIIVAAS